MIHVFMLVVFFQGAELKGAGMHFYDIELPTTLLPQHVRAIFLYVDCNYHLKTCRRWKSPFQPNHAHIRDHTIDAQNSPGVNVP